ncbi:MAG: G1 family glutamic endopeptidase [Solirubrobacteraceae bacterium]
MTTAITAMAACVLGAIPAAPAQADVQQATSENWSGYVAEGSGTSKSFKTVSGTWVVPRADCSSAQGYASFWVGLGGAGQTRSLEQTGTEVSCSGSGTASYSAWYELVPAAPVTVNMAVKPGDTIAGKVTVNGSDVTVSLSNRTSGATFHKTLTMSNPDVSTAEWIAEAPSACQQGTSGCSTLPLADFGTVQFSNASATTTDGHTGTISDSDWSSAAVALNPNSGTMGFGGPQFASQSASAGATPSSLTSDGSAFSVTWSSNASATATSGAGYGQGYPSGAYGQGYPTGGYVYVYPGDGYVYVSPGWAYGYGYGA